MARNRTLSSIGHYRLSYGCPVAGTAVANPAVSLLPVLMTTAREWGLDGIIAVEMGA
jgi:hypothetical protein